MQEIVVSAAFFKTPLKTRLGICIYKTSLLHNAYDYIAFTLSYHPHFTTKLHPCDPALLPNCVDYLADCNPFKKCNPITTINFPIIRPSTLNLIENYEHVDCFPTRQPG